MSMNLVDSEESNDLEMMSEEHSECLLKNRVKLVDNMIPNDVFDYLLQSSVLTIKEKDQIIATGECMNGKLLDTITCKPDKAFGAFVDALKKTGQSHLANLLVPAKKRKPASGRENTLAQLTVKQPHQTEDSLETKVKVEGINSERKRNLCPSQGNFNAGSKENLINQPREDQLLSSSGNVKEFQKDIKSLPDEVISQLGSADSDELADSQDSDDLEMMSKEHKKWLKCNRVQLVQNMIPDGIFDYLLQSGVLRITEKNRIKAEGPSMNEKLIDTIMCKPNSAFSVFVHALKETGQEHLANLPLPTKKRKRGSDASKRMEKKRKGSQPSTSAEQVECKRPLIDIDEKNSSFTEKSFRRRKSEVVNETRRYSLRS